MFDGWLFDVYADHETDRMVSWILTNSGAERVSDRYMPVFYVHPADVPEAYTALSSVAAVEKVVKRDILGKEREMLAITVKRYSELRNLAENIDAYGNYSKYRLYDVDVRLSQRYMLSKDIFPGLVKVDKTIAPAEDMLEFEYDIPRMKTLEIKAGFKQKFPRMTDRLSYVDCKFYDGEWDIKAGIEKANAERLEGCETEVLGELDKLVEKRDPDLVLTEDGDSFLISYLYRRAGENGIKFRLGREDPELIEGENGNNGDREENMQNARARFLEGAAERARVRLRGRDRYSEGSDKSYFSYGRVKYKSAQQFLKGRIHVCRRNSPLFDETGLHGIVELARLSRIPIQPMARLSPGTAISGMQINWAMSRGIVVPWKKNAPEKFKSFRELLSSDRGGYIHTPVVGLHENVAELDFSSFYPSIISKYNISPETLQCECHKGERLVPGLGYNTCANPGMLAQVLSPVIARRAYYKKKAEHDKYKGRQSALKWVLVTCFGYTGYKNAKFGKIECHESINAYGREILLDAIEESQNLGCKVLHAIVDSMWLEGARCVDAAKAIEERVKMDIKLEGIYNWVVFLPNKSNGIGALNRYYGVFNNGEIKVRGIDLRKHDTPQLFRELQSEMLEVLSKAKNKDEFMKALPGTLDVLWKYARLVVSGECDPRKLIFKRYLSKDPEEYTQNNYSRAAVSMLKDDIKLSAGQAIQFLITPSKGRRPKAKPVELLEPGEAYDRTKYLQLLMRSAESLLLPFGYDENTLLKLVYGRQKRLNNF